MSQEPEAITEMRGAHAKYVLCLNSDRMQSVVAYVDALTAEVAWLTDELGELCGAAEQSVIRGNEVIRLGRELVDYREQCEAQAALAASPEAREALDAGIKEQG